MSENNRNQKLQFYIYIQIYSGKFTLVSLILITSSSSLFALDVIIVVVCGYFLADMGNINVNWREWERESNFRLRN